MYCSNCGNEIKDTDKFCEKCGTSLENNVTNEIYENEITESEDINKDSNIEAHASVICKNILICSIIVFVANIIMGNIVNALNFEMGVLIAKVALYVSIGIGGVSLLGYIISFATETETILQWIIVLICIVTVVITVYTVSDTISEENATNSAFSTSTTTLTLSLDTIEIRKWYTTSSTNIDGASQRLFNIVWNGVIKEYYPNATWTKFTIYDKDDYGRYIVGISFIKSSTSEEITNNWCGIYVEDINDISSIKYWKWNPTGVSYIYNYIDWDEVPTY